MEEEKKTGGFWKGFLTATIMFGALIAVICIVFVMGMRMKISRNSGNSEDTGKSLTTQSNQVQSKLGLLESYIRGYYLEEVDRSELEHGIYTGLVNALEDPYSVYYSAEELEELQMSTEGIYYGIYYFSNCD